MSNKKLHVIAFVALAIFTLYVLKDFWQIGFTNSDDADCYVRALQNNYLQDAVIWAKGQGRFFLCFRTILAYFPYIFDSFFWTKTIQYLPIVGSFILSSVIITKVFKSPYIGYGLYLLLISLFTVPTADFVPPTAYPFLFSTDILLFLFSLFFLIKYYSKKQYYFFILSLLCFFIPFYSYEDYIFFFMAYFGFIIYKSNPKFNCKEYFQYSSLKETIPPLILVFLFYGIYFSFRLKFASNYDGNTLAKDLDVSNLFYFIFNVNKSAYPAYVYFHSTSILHIPSSLLENLIFILKTSTLRSIFMALVSGIGLTFLFYKGKIQTVNFKLLVQLLLVTIFLTYSINLIPGLSEKYNGAFYKLDAYVTTFFAFYGIVFSIFIVLIIIFKALRSLKNKMVLNSFFGILFISLFFTHLFINYSNKLVSKDWQLSQIRFKYVDQALDKGIFNEIPKESCVIAPQLFNSKSILGQNVITNTFSWNKYIRAKSGKQLNIFKDLKSAKLFKNAGYAKKEVPIFVLQFSKEKKESVKIQLQKLDVLNLNSL